MKKVGNNEFLVFVFLLMVVPNVLGQDIKLVNRKSGRKVEINSVQNLKISLIDGRTFLGLVNVVNDSQLTINTDTVLIKDISSYRVFKKNQKKWGGCWLVAGALTMIYSGINLGNSSSWDELNYLPVLGMGVVIFWVGINTFAYRTHFKSKKWAAVKKEKPYPG